ncbi:tetratricopeptide repeat family protein [Anoxybacillus sp. B7M1]|uniref:tetratricopeptide repeat protein n=1 Tax=unclassified Anoxybacillus TaxID=2639704 RepID=UPI0005CD99E0|nr:MULTISPECIES: tetratricopeptide repeat protein [unclassified Anoxybacillus]ANB58598.1 tetratricopeptide repeat family protein [Anoxybacillus sp. B2M1]ANB65115.1 tetratricopeptide repeat family protein [Anoxybacillus sp. B7M1]
MGKQLKRKRSAAKVIPFVQSGEYYFKKGLIAYKRGDLARAKKYLERAVQLNGQEAMFAFQLAIVLAELGEYQASNQLFLTVVHELDPEMSECFYFLAHNYAHLGLFREAMNHAQTYLEREPDGEFLEEIEDLIELLSIEYEDDEFISQEDLIVKQEKARSLLEKGDFPAAIEVLEAMIAEYPEFWSAYNNLSLAYFYMGNAEKAQSIIDEVLEKNPGNLHALCNRLVFFHYLQDEAEVARLTEELACVHPFLIDQRYKLGATFALVGRFDLAFKWLHHLYKMRFHGDFLFYYWLAYSAYYTGHARLAKTAWEKVIDLSPDKKGQEPWGVFEEKVKRWMNGTNIAEVLYGLYVISKSLNADEVKAYIHVKETMEQHWLVREFIDYILLPAQAMSPLYIVDAYAVMDELWEKNVLADEKMYITWFHVFANAVDVLRNFSNYQAWAAAIEYVWRRNQGESVTQKGIGEKYSISLSTVQKYVKQVRKWL